VSGEVVGWAFKQRNLSPTQKLVLVAIADNAQDDGKAWPGKGTIVKKTGLGKSSVYRSLDELEDVGLIRRGVDERRIECYWLAVPGWEEDSQDGNGNSHSGKPYIEEPSTETSENQPPSPTSAVVKSQTTRAIEDVWATFVAVMNPRGRGAELDSESRKLIRDALKVADVAELQRAIETCGRSDFHMKRGKHKSRSGARYNKLPQIIKARRGRNETTRSRIEWWLEKADDLDAGKEVVFDVNAEAERIRREQEAD
jgi:hypothetical protein